MNTTPRSWSLVVMIVFCIAFGTSNLGALSIQILPLAERVKSAKVVALGKLVNKVVEGEWVRAEILVMEPLVNAEQGEKIAVIWRATLDSMPIYDTDEGSIGVILLDDKHEGRYWLRADRFENEDKLEEIKKLLKDA